MRNVLQVKVTNNNKADIEDRYDGILYKLKSGVACSIPYEAACHIFGVDFAPDATGHLNPELREVAFKHLQKRWGWNRSSEAAESRKRFDKIEFTLTTMVMVEQTVAEEEEVELPKPHEIEGRKKGFGSRKEA